MSEPLIFLAFANNESASILKLDEEGSRLYDVLSPGKKNNFYDIYREPFATVERISKYLINNKDQVLIFHYGGHANARQLLLTEQGANAEGIVQLLKGQQQLQLVFLNACSTQEQVRLLLEAGIPAVIATSQDIDDNLAVAFAEHFYDALVKEHSLREAFETAAGIINSSPGLAGKMAVRGIKLADAPQEPDGAGELPWGLYCESETTLAWKLPRKDQRQKEIIIRDAGDRYNFSKVPLNQKLTEVLLNVLGAYSEELEFYLFKKEKGSDIDFRKLRRALMDALPAPVGEQVRKLFSVDAQSADIGKIGVPRLEQLVNTYDTLVELLTHILLAELWEMKILYPESEVPPETLEEVRGFLCLDREGVQTYNYIGLARSILQAFDAMGIFQKTDGFCFIEELEDLWKACGDDEVFGASCDFMMAMRKEVQSGNIAATEIESYCVQSEEHLSDVFAQLGFIAKYKLSTIKNIDIIKPRNKKARFRHIKVRLDTITAGYADEEQEYEGDYTDNRSVLLLKNEEHIKPYLSLSPFVIDENALKGEEKTKLFFFNFGDRTARQINYRYTYVRKDELLLKDQYPEIWEQFDDFSQLFFSKNFMDL